MKEKRNTIQKEIVFDIFNSMTNHPSAGMVYDAVHAKYPGISRATVYRLLAEAADDGRILRVKLSDALDRYDFTVKRHYHIVCRECGAVADVETEFPREDVLRHTTGCENFSVEECHLEFLGVCEKCQNKNEKLKMY